MRSTGRTSFQPKRPGRPFAIVPVGVRTELGVEVSGLVEQTIGDPPGERLFRIVVTSQVPVADRMRARRQRLFRDGDEFKGAVVEYRAQEAVRRVGANVCQEDRWLSGVGCWMWSVHGTFNVRPWTRGGRSQGTGEGSNSAPNTFTPLPLRRPAPGRGG